MNSLYVRILKAIHRDPAFVIARVMVLQVIQDLRIPVYVWIFVAPRKPTDTLRETYRYASALYRSLPKGKHTLGSGYENKWRISFPEIRAEELIGETRGISQQFYLPSERLPRTHIHHQLESCIEREVIIYVFPSEAFARQAFERKNGNPDWFFKEDNPLFTHWGHAEGHGNPEIDRCRGQVKQ